MAATHVRRFDPVVVSEGFLTANDMVPGHPEEFLIVLDWISGHIISTTGGDAGFDLLDTVNDLTNNSTLTGVVYRFMISTAASEAEPVHLTFPGGFPLKRQPNVVATISKDILSGDYEPGGDVSISATNWDSGALFFGFHMERTSARR